MRLNITKHGHSFQHTLGALLFLVAGRVYSSFTLQRAIFLISVQMIINLTRRHIQLKTRGFTEHLFFFRTLQISSWTKIFSNVCRK